MSANKTSKDGSILGKVTDFQEELRLHEAAGLNSRNKCLATAFFVGSGLNPDKEKVLTTSFRIIFHPIFTIG